jgi:hypothetical protein
MHALQAHAHLPHATYNRHDTPKPLRAWFWRHAAVWVALALIALALPSAYWLGLDLSVWLTRTHAWGRLANASGALGVAVGVLTIFVPAVVSLAAGAWLMFAAEKRGGMDEWNNA